MDAVWSGARAVVTGASGFLGRHLVEHLAADGATVVGLDRLPAPPGSSGEHRVVDLGAPGIETRLHETLGSADVVFHLAGGGAAAARSGRANARDNAVATAAVLGATPAGVPLVVASSGAAYGGACRSGGEIRPSEETDPLRPHDARSRSKVFVERLCARRRAGGGLVTVVRPFTVAGPGQPEDRTVARWLSAAEHGFPAQVIGATDRRRDLVDIRQVGPALAGIAAQSALDVVNLGTGSPVTAAAVLDAIGAALGRPVLVDIEPAPRELPAVTCASTARLEEVLGWVPETDLDALVRAQVESRTNLHSRVVSANMA
jgi:nucleoside-diphosphate-sugar epimerase